MAPVLRRSSRTNTPSLKPTDKEADSPGVTIVAEKRRSTKASKGTPSPKAPKPTKAKKTSPEPKRELDDLDIAMKNLEYIRKEKQKINLADLKLFRKQFKAKCDEKKRESQILDQEHTIRKTAGTTRSGAKRGVKSRAVCSDGKFVNKGIDDSQETYAADEIEYLKKKVEKTKKVEDLKFDDIRYLVMNIFLDELKAVREGKLASEFHDRYLELKGKSKLDLFSDIRTSLFTSEQRDYISGLLQGAFDTTSKDVNGDIKHSDINYVGTVLLAEISIRIVKFVHKFETKQEAVDFMTKNSREAAGYTY